jgi:hypothetical protein
VEIFVQRIKLTHRIPMPVLPSSSDVAIVEFARAFLDEHLVRFRKDIKICLTPNAEGDHAYFPALMTCIAFVEFLSGLYAGNLDGPGLKQLKKYAVEFMPLEYTADRLDVLYECFRHKVAHLALPCAVFDTDTKPRTFRDQPRRLITWTVTAGRGKPPIEIAKVKPAKQIEMAVTPWPVHYDHRATVYLCNLVFDIKNSVPKYLRRLEANKTARDHFRKCMVVWFPQ